jgi:hypothetical protein
MTYPRNDRLSITLAVAAIEGGKEMIERIPVISLWQPWAQWVSLGWKTVETRTHKRFANLQGKRIGIHAALTWDKTAFVAAHPYLTQQQFEQSATFLKLGGAIICTAFVAAHVELLSPDSKAALIDCASVKRYGLILADVRPIEAVPCAGKQGIWYAEIETGKDTAHD